MKFAIPPELQELADQFRKHNEASWAKIQEVFQLSNAKLDEACASVLACGWSPEDCRIDRYTHEMRETLVVRDVVVFEIKTEITIEGEHEQINAHVTWQWLAPIPPRDGYTKASA